MLEDLKRNNKQLGNKEHLSKNIKEANGVLNTLSRNVEGITRNNELYVRKQSERVKEDFLNTYKDEVLNDYKKYMPELSKYLDDINIDLKDNQDEVKCFANTRENKVVVRITENLSNSKSVEELNQVNGSFTGIESTLDIQFKDVLQHEFGHFIWYEKNLLGLNNNLVDLYDRVTLGATNDSKEKRIDEFYSKQMRNTPFSDLGEGFAISMEFILLEKEIEKNKNFSDEKITRYLEARKKRFSNEEIISSKHPDETKITALDSMSTIYRIYKDFEKIGNGEKAIIDFMKHLDVEKLISIKKFEEGHYLERERISNEEIEKVAGEQEKLIGRILTEKEKDQITLELRQKSLNAQVKQYEKMIGRELTEKEIETFRYEGVIGDKLTQEYKEFVKMSGTDIIKTFLTFNIK